MLSLAVLALFIKYYFKPFFIMVALIYACTPIYRFLTKGCHFHKKVSAVLSILIVNAAASLIIFYGLKILFIKINTFINENYGYFMSNLEHFVHNTKVVSKLSFSTNLVDRLKESLSTIFNSEVFRKGAIVTTDSLLAYFIAIMLVYFILVDQSMMQEWLQRVVSRERLNQVYDKLSIIQKIIRIELLLVFITTVVTILGLIALGIENAVFLGLLCGIFDILPYIGAIIVFVPLVMLKIITKQYIIAFGLLCLYILLLMNRQILESKFMSHQLNVHPLLIILFSYLGMKVLGIIGLFFGPLYVILAKEIIMMQGA